MPIDRSLSKTAEDILKAAALFGLALFTLDRAAFDYWCVQDDNFIGIIGTAAIALIFVLFGIALILVRIRNLYPWVFFGPSWWGKTIYIIAIVIIALIGQPIARTLMQANAAEYHASGSACSTQRLAE